MSARDELRFGILGALEITRAGEPIEVGPTKHRALLAILLLGANRLLPADRLIEELWGGEPPATALSALQVYVAKLRKALEVPGAARAEQLILTRAPGYVLRIETDQLDMSRFERLAGEAARLLEQGDHAAAAERSAEALGCWRGQALADFPYEPFAQTPSARLEELRLAALETRVEAELGLGRHGELVPQLRELATAHPTRERLCGQLMLALYRAGRQADALDVYQRLRRHLVEELGIDPGAALQRLERAILQHDPELEAPGPASPAGSRVPVGRPARAILVPTREPADLAPLLPFARSLARSAQPHELILLRLTRDAPELAPATAELAAHRAELQHEGVAVRVAAYTSRDPAGDTLRTSHEQDVDLCLCVLREPAGSWPADVHRLLDEAPCDVGLLVPGRPCGDLPVAVLFAGASHDWGALELAAWLASARGASLLLLGADTGADPEGRDASRLLAVASLAVQELVGVVAEPTLVGRDALAVAAATTDTAVLVVPLPDDWRTGGLGSFRTALLAAAPVDVLLVRSGVRPGGLTPTDGLTRYTWSLSPVGP